MDTKVKSTVVPQNNQPTVDGNPIEPGREKAPTFHVQTGLRAGGFYDWWGGASEGYNAADASTQTWDRIL